MAAIGAALAGAGLLTYTIQGVRNNQAIAQGAKESNYRGAMAPPTLYVDDPTHKKYGVDMPITYTSKGAYGVPRTYYNQAGNSQLRIYGTPSDNSLTKTQ